jgi:nucleoside-diphosphate-sugar epimerase
MATIAITGASGFIGRVVTAQARQAGHEVIALSRSDGSLPRGYEDVDALARAFANAQAVVHLAAKAHVGGIDADFECNVRSARAVAQAAKATGAARVVLASSIGVNGNVTREHPFTEADAPRPVEPYARSKLRAEQEVQSVLAGSRTQWVIVRPPLVYGAGAPGNFGRLVRAVERGWPLPLGGIDNRRSLVGADNLADAMLACCTHPAAANQTFLVADGDDLSTPDIVRCIARGLKREARLWNVPPFALRAAAALAGRSRVAESLCESLQVDASRIRSVLGWAPAHSAEQGIERAAAGSAG